VKLILSIFLLASFLEASDDSARILRAIALVESGADLRAVGDGGLALGAWQIHAQAWEDANAFREAMGLPKLSRSRWREAGVQEGVAKALFSVLAARLQRVGVRSPTPGQIALCWNCGFAGAQARGFRLNPYARRVEGLVKTF